MLVDLLQHAAAMEMQNAGITLAQFKALTPDARLQCVRALLESAVGLPLAEPADPRAVYKCPACPARFVTTDKRAKHVAQHNAAHPKESK